MIKLTVADLIEKLMYFPPSARIVFNVEKAYSCHCCAEFKELPFLKFDYFPVPECCGGGAEIELVLKGKSFDHEGPCHHDTPPEDIL